jgi:OmpA-OmpF porin, OOP family
MTRTMQALVALSLALGLAVPSSGMAQGMAADTGWYVGASIGQSKADDFCTGVPGGVSCEDTDTALRVLGGYQFNKHLGLEVGYHQLGEVSVSALGLFAKVESKAWELLAVGTLPVADRFALYGKVGVYRGETEAATNVPGFAASMSETNTDLTFGIGLRFDITGNLGVRAEWQKYQDMGGGNIGEADIDVMSIGLLYRFR